MKGLNINVNPIEISEGAKLKVAAFERRLFTEFDSVLGESDFGSIVPTLMYEPATPGLAREILREVQDILTEDEDVNIESLYVNFEPFTINGQESMTLEIGFSFSMRESEKEEVVDVSFFRIAELS